MKLSRYLFLFLMGFFSCGEKNLNQLNGKSEEKTAYFEKLDSIRIDYLGNVKVHDLNPISKTVLFDVGGAYSQEIVLAGFDGKIINSFSKFGDVPDSYGILLSSMRLLDNNSFIVYGYNGFLTYSFEGKALSRVKRVDFQPPSYTPVFMGQGMEKLRDRYLYVNQTFPENKDYSNLEMYKKMYLMNLLDPETGEKELFIQFPETSIFRNGKYFFRNAWDPVFHYTDERIYLAFGLEPVIYVFDDNPPYSLLSTFPIDLKDYRYFKGADRFSSDWTFFGLRFTSGMILNIKKLNNYFMVAYFPGYEDADLEIRFSNKSEEETLEFNARMNLKYPNRIAVLDSVGNMLYNFEPDRLVAESMLIRNGELWMMEKPDEELERDYFKLFRVGLKIED